MTILFALILFLTEAVGNTDESIVELGRKVYVTMDHVNFVNDTIYVEVEGIIYETPAINSDENGFYIDRVAKSGSCRWYEWQCRNKKCNTCNLNGEHNAELFSKRDELESRNLYLKKRKTQPSPGFDSIEEEHNALRSRLQPFTDEGRYTLCFMRLPGFMADRRHRETVQLKHKYRQQRKYITQLYLQGNILEITLAQLCQ